MRASAFGDQPSERLTPEDIRLSLGASSSRSTTSAVFPPEFSFNPASGDALDRTEAPARSVWIAPSGADGARLNAHEARGLNGSYAALSLERSHTRRAEDDADVRREPPPAGHYEFFSIPAATVRPALLAIEPFKGRIYAWFDANPRWEPMREAGGGGVLAETRIQSADWRAEAVIDKLTTRLFLPTEYGIGCVTPDALALSFSVTYHGNSPAIGSPVNFGDRVWAPLRTADGDIKVVGIDLAGADLHEVALAAAVPVPGRVAAPVMNGASVIWVTEAGQLLLTQVAGAGLTVSFEPWPATIKPALEFGRPYLSRSGTFWQLCWDSQSEAFVYARLGRGGWEMHNTQIPRVCSGNFNFRFSQVYRSPPWEEPEQGDDSASDTVIVPVLESLRSSTVFGMKFKSTQALEELLKERESTRVVLTAVDANSHAEFGSLKVPVPLKLRLFVHDGYIWAYHPDLPRLEGWAISP